MKSFIPGHIYIEEGSLDEPVTRRILDRFADVPYTIVEDSVSGGKSVEPDAPTITTGKRNLFLRRSRGPFIERCPGTKDALCCNYRVANLAVNCHFDCTYCYLQGYLNTRNIILYTNLGDFFREVDELAASPNGSEIRIGTGELADSLALDEMSGFTKDIVPYFARFPNLLLELKTKGSYIDNLLSVDPGGRTVVAWSLNPDVIIRAEEHKCAPLRDRLRAARECANAGYKLAFHFDPIILHDGWEENYRRVVKMLFEHVSPADIRWISLGVLRFTPAGKTAIQNRFAKTSIIYDEFVPCSDGKLRYLRPVRGEIFRTMRSYIREHSPDTFIYLCMENEAVWRRTFGDGHPAAMQVAHF